MMNNKVVEIKKKADEIKALYESYLKFKEQKFSYANLETKDGEALFIDEGADLKVGIPVYKMDENGAPMPCEDGSYELKDGKTITVVDGVIGEIAEPTGGEESPGETAAPEAEQEMAGQEKERKREGPGATDVEDAGSGMEERMVALEKNVEKMMEMIQGLMSKYEEDLSKVSQKMNKLIITSGEEITRTNTDSVKSKMNKESFMADLKEYSQMRDFKKTSTTKKVETFGTQTNPTRAEQLSDMRKLMSDARKNGGLGSIIAAAN